MIQIANKRILVLSPHADDMELGCGGSVARFVEQGAELHTIVFSLRQLACPPGYTEEDLRGETIRAGSELGIASSNLTIYNYENRTFPSIRQELLDLLVSHARRIKPHLVLAPSLDDWHQDHRTLAEEAFRAFKQTSLFGYELSWNRTVIHFQAFIKLQQRHIDAKIRALQQYGSQLELRPEYFDGQFVRSLAKVRGTQVRYPLAEAFEVVRLVSEE